MLGRVGFLLNPGMRSLDSQVGALFSAGEQGAWYDPSDLASLKQNSNGTTAVAVGDPVGFVADKSGRGNNATQATSTKRPILRQAAGGYYYLEFDGVDDELATAWGVVPMPDESYGIYLAGTNVGGSGAWWWNNLLGTTSKTNAFRGNASTTAVNHYYWSNDLTGTVANMATASVLGVTQNISTAPKRQIWQNGTQVATNDVIGVTPTAAAANSIGRGSTAGEWLQGGIYGLISVRRLLTASEKGLVNTLLGRRIGVAL